MATADGGRTWTYQQSGTDIDLVDVAALSDEIAYLFGRGRGLGGDFDENPRILLKTVDGGQTWSEVQLDPGYKLESRDFLDDGQHGWLSVTVTGGHALLNTSDGGASWTIGRLRERVLRPDAVAERRRSDGRVRLIVPFRFAAPTRWYVPSVAERPGQEVLPLETYGPLNPFCAFSVKSAVVARIGLKAPNSWWDWGVMRTDDGGTSWSAVAQGERESTQSADRVGREPWNTRP